MKKEMIIAVRLTILLTILSGVVYPGAMTLVARLLFPHRASGSLVVRDGILVGSSLIGQQFSSDRYFHGRPSWTNYDPFPSGASNLSPTSSELAEQVHARQMAFCAENGLDSSATIPPEMLYASASGLDPDVSPEAVVLQVGRIARARGLDSLGTERLKRLVVRFSQQRQLGILGSPRVNVLLLNIALDRELR
jgi:K+-transporting ATPase ATPase C chain